MLRIWRHPQDDGSPQYSIDIPDVRLHLVARGPVIIPAYLDHPRSGYSITGIPRWARPLTPIADRSGAFSSWKIGSFLVYALSTAYLAALQPCLAPHCHPRLTGLFSYKNVSTQNYDHDDEYNPRQRTKVTNCNFRDIVGWIMVRACRRLACPHKHWTNWFLLYSVRRVIRGFRWSDYYFVSQIACSGVLLYSPPCYQ